MIVYNGAKSEALCPNLNPNSNRVSYHWLRGKFGGSQREFELFLARELMERSLLLWRLSL